MVGFGRVAAGSVAGALALALIAACGTLSDPPLQHSFLVQLVRPSSSRAEAASTLETSVLEAVIDRRPGQAATSRVTIRFLLIQSDLPYQVLLDRTFTHAEPVQGGGAEGEVAALSRAASGVLRDFEDALAKTPN